MSSPSWYDLLGVAPDASPAEIKAAWREATDKFEPGSGASQFRLFNEAADVLLDPQKRNAYDAELAGGTTAEATGELVTEPVVTEPAEDADEAEAAPVAAEPEPDPEPEPDAEPVPDAEPATSRGARLRALLTSTVALVVLAVLAVASVVFAAVALNREDLGAKADEYKAGRSAQSTAREVLGTVLSYDYRQLDTPAKLDATLNSITAGMTPELGEKYRKAFVTVCRPDIDSPATAVARQSVVTSTVEDPAVIDAGADRVRLLVFVSQETRNKDGGPTSRPSQVVATMIRKGSKWLLESIEPKGQTPPQCVDPSAPATPSAP